MSLAIPYILEAAAETSPRAVITVAGCDVTATDLNRRTRARADRYLSDGHQRGERIMLPPLNDLVGVVDALAATRVGLVLTDRVTTPSTGLVDADDRQVTESRLWSESALASIAGATVTHGEAIGASRHGSARLPAELELFVQAIRAVDQALARDSASSRSS